MPKKIYNNFLGGFANNDRLGTDDQFDIGRDIDIHRDLGYLKPGYLGSILNSTSQLASLVVDFAIRQVGVSPSTPQVYAIESGKLHRIDPATDGIESASPFPHALPVNRVGKGVFVFNGTAPGTGSIMYVLDNNIGLETNGTFDDDWLSTVPAGGAVLNSLAPDKPYLVWQNYFWIGDLNKLGRFDGETGANGTWTAGALTLPLNYKITALFSSQNYIGICVWVAEHGSGITPLSRYRASSFVLLWDGVSPTYNYLIPISDNKITSAFNDNGIVYLFTDNKDLAGALHLLQSDGSKKLRKLNINLAGTRINITAPKLHAVESYDNKTLFGGGNYDLVMAQGRADESVPPAFFQPFSNTAVSGGIVGAIKVIDTDKIYVSYQVSSTYTIKKYTTGNSTSAAWKPLYADFGQKVRINYVKFYFKPLVASDSITAALEVDYGKETINLGIGAGNIQYNIDGAITQKRFDVKRICHAFRPSINWVAGGVAVSKVVVDYDFVDDL